MTSHIVITGASRGIGACFAQNLAKQGHSLVLAARSGADLARLADALSKDASREVLCVACDLSTSQGVATLLEVCAPLRISGLINNAGFGLGGPFLQQRLDNLEQMLQLNIWTLTTLTHNILPKLIQEEGFLINVASQAGFQPVPFMSAYAASKAYVLHFTEGLHEEMLPFNVKVQALCPAPTATSFFDVAGIDVKTTKFKLGSVEAVVAAALKGLKANKAIVIPGWRNRLLTYSIRLVTRAHVAKIGQKLMGH